MPRAVGVLFGAYPARRPAHPTLAPGRHEWTKKARAADISAPAPTTQMTLILRKSAKRRKAKKSDPMVGCTAGAFP